MLFDRRLPFPGDLAGRARSDGDKNMPSTIHEALTALADYAQAQIEARARGGRTITDARRQANRRNASQPRRKRKPQCPCGAMTQDRAAKRGHVCE